MTVDLWRSHKTAVANWTGASYSPCITFEEDGSGAHVDYSVDIQNISQSGGGQDTEGIVCFGNKRITQLRPQEDIEVALEVIFTDTTFDQMMYGGTLSSGQIVSGTEYGSNATNKKRWRITITWQDPDSTTETSAERLRWIFKDCYAVSWEPEQSSDEYLKGTITFKVPPTDKSGNSSMIKEYRTTGSMTTLAAAHGGAENSYTYNP